MADCNYIPLLDRRPGVSIQPTNCLVPVQDDCNIYDCQTSQNDLKQIAGTFSNEQWLKGWIISQLTTDAMSQEFLQYGGSRRGWWADSIRDDGFKIGSLLWTINLKRRSKQETINLVKQYCNDALKWLKTWNIVDTINIVPKWVSDSTITVDISIEKDCNILQQSIVGNVQSDNSYLFASVQ